MRVAVVGGAGFVGTRVCKRLEARGHEPIVVDLTTGANTITGEGLDRALTGVEAVIDVTNSSSMEADAAANFFITSATNILQAEKSLGIKHHVLLSIVGADRVPQSGYLRAKAAQEAVVAESGVPYCIVRSTQFFPFIGQLVESHRSGSTVRVPRTRFQPVDVGDAADYLIDMATHAPMNRPTEIAGPEQGWFEDYVRRHLAGRGDAAEVVVDSDAPFFDSPVGEHDLVPHDSDMRGATTYTDWAASDSRV